MGRSILVEQSVLEDGLTGWGVRVGAGGVLFFGRLRTFCLVPSPKEERSQLGSPQWSREVLGSNPLFQNFFLSLLHNQ